MSQALRNEVTELYNAVVNLTNRVAALDGGAQVVPVVDHTATIAELKARVTAIETLNADSVAADLAAQHPAPAEVVAPTVEPTVAEVVAAPAP
jgi:hypothetical protein